MRPLTASIAILLCAGNVFFVRSQTGSMDQPTQQQRPGVGVPIASASNVTTLQVPLDDKLRQQIASAVANPEQPQTVQVKVEGVAPPSSASRFEDGGLKVFVNKPDASQKTSEKDPHFIGAVEYQPTSSSKLQSFLLDAGPALAELARKKQLDLDKPITVSVVRAGEAPSKGVVKVESVQVHVPKQR